ncbi:MAG TPA: PcfJ domain-containing protein [Nannocystaceae bacterium]|nr:PcfJ domain-containing protein [Nannocystaceae bacterium]
MERREARLAAGVSRKRRCSNVDAEHARALLAARRDDGRGPLARFTADDEVGRLLAPVVARVRDVAPKILGDPMLHIPLVLLAVRAPIWQRPLASWQPLGKSRRTQLDSLIDHLLVCWRVPRFLYCVFHDGPTRSAGVDLFVHLAQGGSLQRAIELGLLPAALNRVARHAFMKVALECSVIAAVRFAQVQAFGGSHVLACELLETFLGRELVDDGFWSRVIQWICERDAVEPGRLGHALDLIRAARERNPSLSPAARTLRGIVHEPTPQPATVWVAGVDKQPYRGSGFAPGEWTLDDPGGAAMRETWTITEIRDPRELAIEGALLRHCVFTYHASVRRGGCSIWSLRRDGARRLTIEVWNQSLRVVQVRGRKNRAPRTHEISLLMRWAEANGLRVTASLDA